MDQITLEGEGREGQGELRLPTHALCLKNLRRHSGLSQDELSKKLGVSRAAVVRIEKGDTIPSPRLLAKMESLADESRRSHDEAIKQLRGLREGAEKGFELGASRVDELEELIDDEVAQSGEEAEGSDGLLLAALGIGLLWAAHR